MDRCPLTKIACIQCTTDSLWWWCTQLPSHPPTLYIHSANCLSCTTQWCMVMACWWRGFVCAPQQRGHVFATALTLHQLDFLMFESETVGWLGFMGATGEV
jgi:hypothetical protein